jgi:hypothetical protein
MKLSPTERPVLQELLEAELLKLEQTLILNKETLVAYRDAFSKEEQKKFNRALAQFDENASTVLGEILAREQSGEIPTAKRQHLIDAFALACASYADAWNVNGEALDRLTAKLGTQKARGKRTSNKASVRQVVRKHALRAWERNPKSQDNAHATANKILSGVNAELLQLYPKIGNQKLDTTRKHVAQIQRELKRRP